MDALASLPALSLDSADSTPDAAKKPQYINKFTLPKIG